MPLADGPALLLGRGEPSIQLGLAVVQQVRLGREGVTDQHADAAVRRLDDRRQTPPQIEQGRKESAPLTQSEPSRGLPPRQAPARQTWP